jgi:uncharacterized repeat protein (TIGR01451 family)
MKKTFIVVASAALAMFFGFSGNVRAQTGASTNIGNTAVVSGANFSVANSVANITVATILGARAASELDDGSPTGVTRTNTLTVTNKGNVSASFVFKFLLGQTNATGGSAWTSGFGAGQTPTATTASIGPGVFASVDFRVTVPAIASNGAFRSYVIKASNEFTGATAILTNYLGDNGTAYGGDLGDNLAGAKNVFAAQTASSGTASNTTVPVAAIRTWQVTISAAVVAITKTAAVSGPAGTLPVPGATVTYKIALTNTGSSGATGVEVRDNRPANTAYVATSLRGYTGTATAYSGAGTLTDGNSDDAGAASATYVEFSPNSTSADQTVGNGGTGTLATTDGRAFYFRVTIN